jgi:hypothetical protein
VNKKHCKRKKQQRNVLEHVEPKTFFKHQTNSILSQKHCLSQREMLPLRFLCAATATFNLYMAAPTRAYLQGTSAGEENASSLFLHALQTWNESLTIMA